MSAKGKVESGARRIREQLTSKKFDVNSYIAPQLTRKQKVQVEEVLLFSVVDEDNPDDVKNYYVPTKVSRAATLTAMRLHAEGGEAAATSFILTTVLGEEGYDALCAADWMEDEDFDRILEAASNIVMGPEGKGRTSEQ